MSKITKSQRKSYWQKKCNVDVIVTDKTFVAALRLLKYLIALAVWFYLMAK